MHADWLDIGPLDQLTPLGARTLKVAGGETIAIFLTATGSVHALIDRCPHKGGPLSQGIVHDQSVTCPLHAMKVSLLTGEVTGGMAGADAPMPCAQIVPVKLDSGRVFLHRARTLASAA